MSQTSQSHTVPSSHIAENMTHRREIAFSTLDLLLWISSKTVLHLSRWAEPVYQRTGVRSGQANLAPWRVPFSCRTAGVLFSRLVAGWGGNPGWTAISGSGGMSQVWPRALGHTRQAGGWGVCWQVLIRAQGHRPIYATNEHLRGWEGWEGGLWKGDGVWEGFWAMQDEMVGLVGGGKCWLQRSLSHPFCVSVRCLSLRLRRPRQA